MLLLPFWRLEERTIVRTFPGGTFVSVVGILNSIAILAEKADHHPDLRIYGWNKLDVTLSTHDQGGLTELDFNLAREIDALRFDISL